MKERLKQCLQEAKEALSQLSNKKEYVRLCVLVYFVSTEGALPVHLILDIATVQDVDPDEFDEEPDMFYFVQSEILGEVSDNYQEIKKFLTDSEEEYGDKLSPFAPGLLLLFHGMLDRKPLTMKDIIELLESASEDGDFSLWNRDLDVGFRIDEKIS